MALPRISICPSTRVLGAVSCIRLMQRSNVDLPHPEGPMIAVTACCGTTMEISLIAGVSPKNAHRSLVIMHGFSAVAASRDSGAAGRGATTRGITRGSRETSIDWSTELGPGYDTRSDADD